jgi:hypothetical protein
MRPEQFLARKEGNIFLTKMLNNHDDGWFNLKHRHLRNIPAYLIKTQNILLQWGKHKKKVLLSILLNGTLYLDLEKHTKAITHLFDKLGKDKFCTFMCHYVASCLGEKPFKNRLEYWFDKLGKDKFCTFMCDCVTSHLGKKPFKNKLEYWFDKLGKDEFCTFMCGGVAS